MLLVLTAPMRYLPKATLGAVIVAAAVGLVDLASWRGLARISRVEVAIAAITMAGVVLVGVLEALVVAVALSILDVVRRSATPHDAVLGWVPRLGRYANVACTPAPSSPPACWSTGWTTGCSSPTPATSPGASREAIDGAPAPVRWLVFDTEALSHIGHRHRRPHPAL